IYAINHPTSPNNFDEPVTLAIAGTPAANAGIGVNKTVTLTDGDNDAASDNATANITSSIKIEDDGPDAAFTLSSGKLTVDESVGTDGSIKDESGGAAANNDEVGAPPSPAGAGVIGYGTVTLAALVTDTSDPGSDGLGSKVYTLTSSMAGTAFPTNTAA